jgi:hypothetical protein
MIMSELPVLDMAACALVQSFALVEPFGLAPYILKRRKSLTSVFEIIDRVPKMMPAA